MRNAERSTGACLTALAAAALLAGSLAVPWFEYSFSSGRKTAPGGFGDPADTRVERDALTYTPFAMQGDAAPDDPAQAQSLLDRMGWALVAAAALFALVALVEMPGMPRILPRWLTLVALLGATGTAAAPLWWAWSELPATLASQGVTWPFTATLREDGYVRTTMQWGWAIAALALPAAAGALLFKFQTGPEPDQMLDAARAKGRPQ